MCTTEIGTSKILKVKPLGQLIRYSLSGLEICLRGSVSGHYPAPLAKLGQRCHFEFLPVNGAHAPSCETGGGGKYLFLDELLGPPFVNRAFMSGSLEHRHDVTYCRVRAKVCCRWVCSVVSSSRAEMQGKGCGHAAERAHGWVCGLVPTHAGYQGEEPAASSTWVLVHVIRPVPRNIAATLL